MIIYDAMQSGKTGTTSNQYTTNDPAKAKAATDFMAQWTADNPSGYDSDRAMMDYDLSNGTKHYDAYRTRRQEAYDGWLSQQSQPQQPQQQAPQAPAGATIRMPGDTVASPQNSMTSAATTTNNSTTSGGQMPTGIINTQMQPQTTAQQGAQTTTSNAGQVDANGQILSTQGYNAAQLGDPTKWNVESNQTMQGQLEGILAQNSGLKTLARTNALEQMNERGLLNSSQAVTAGERAVYESAMPIAQNDANTHANAAGYNADISNQFAVQNTGWQNEANMFNAGENNVTNRTNASNQTNLTLGRERNETDLTTNRERNETTRWTSQLQADVSREDLAVRRELGQADIAVKREDIGLRRDLGELDAQTKTNIASMDNATKREMGYLEVNTRTNIANMEANTRLMVTELEGEYRNLLQNNQNAANMFANMSSQIAAIEQANLTSESKAYAIQRQEMMTRDALRVMGAVSGVPNLASFYNWGTYA